MIIQTKQLVKINFSLATAGNAMRHFDLCFSTCAEALPKFRAVRKLCPNLVFAFVILSISDKITQLSFENLATITPLPLAAMAHRGTV